MNVPPELVIRFTQLVSTDTLVLNRDGLLSELKEALTGNHDPRLQMLPEQDPRQVALSEILAKNDCRLNTPRPVVIGCSAGGDQALRVLFKALDYPHVPILVAMHHHPGFRFMTKLELRSGLFQRFIDPVPGETPQAGTAYFLHGTEAFLVNGTNMQFTLADHGDAPRFRPDINLLLERMLKTVGAPALTIILTGMLDDGARALRDIDREGGEVWVQDPAEAAFKQMPQAALDAVPNARVGTLATIAARINAMSLQTLRIVPSFNAFQTVKPG